MKVSIGQMMDALLDNYEVKVVINGEYYDFEPTNAEHYVNCIRMDDTFEEHFGISTVSDIFSDLRKEYKEDYEKSRLDPYKEWDILCGVC